jgi:hypothetical protein
MLFENLVVGGNSNRDPVRFRAILYAPGQGTLKCSSDAQAGLNLSAGQIHKSVPDRYSHRSSSKKAVNFSAGRVH